MTHNATGATMAMGRQPNYKRNDKLEALLDQMSTLLGPVEDRLVKAFDEPRHPVLLVVGGPRSGSTLMMQWLAASGLFAYPSNILSRFHRAPAVGARIQLLLTDPVFDFKNEMAGLHRGSDFISDLGKTSGPLQPNDFWHFWRRFIPNEEPVWLDAKAARKVRGHDLMAELAAIEAVFCRPFAMKGMILEQNIPLLASLFDKMLFLHVKRRPFYNIQSLLESRLKFFGDIGRWYSIKPRQYDTLLSLDPYAQVAGQVYYKNQALEEGLASIPESRWVEVDYENFCQDPAELFRSIVELLSSHGCTLDPTYKGPASFECADRVRMSANERLLIIQAWRRFCLQDIAP